LSEGGAPAGGSGTCYYVGDFDGKTFTPDDDKRLWMDVGKDSYAGTTWSNINDGRTIFIGWMTNQRYSGQIPASTWRGSMTLPRELSLKQTASGWRLIQQPLRELTQLRGEKMGDMVGTIADEKALLPGRINGAVEFVAQFQNDPTAECGICIINGQERIVIGINRQQRSVFVDRSATSGFNNADYLQRQSTALDIDDTIRLQVFVDSTSLEVFVNDGEIVFSELLFMEAANRQLEVYASGGKIVIQEGSLYALSSIYQTKP
jgi:fructan beta-fructosidase